LMSFEISINEFADLRSMGYVSVHYP
jgi:hypothetical protein